MKTALIQVLRESLFLALFLACVIASDFAAAATTLWWDTGYSRRFNISVASGANVPDKGYIGYTARIASLNTAALIAAGQMRPDCSDLRITYYNGLAWQELPRHVLNCNSAGTDIRFALVSNIAAGGSDDNYYVYHGNATPAALPAMTTTNVYLWFDDATVNRATNYVRGRVDPWHGTGWDNSLVWNAAGYYTYNTGDNFTSGYRRNVDERDVYVEAEFYHTGCYQLNMTTGLISRGIIQSGTAGSELSDHYYASNRGQYPGCDVGGYTHDGDIMKRERGTIAVDGVNPPAITANVWRRQGLASWRVAPTNLAFWDANLSTTWAALGFPGAANLHVSGADAADAQGRGFAGFMTAQDQARVRNILIRRYISPEPLLTLTAEQQQPSLVMQKNVLTVFDPFNNTSNPKAIPGSWVDYTITASNSGPGTVDNNSLAITDPLPANVALFVGDLAGPGSGPVVFTDGSGSASSGLSYTFGGLGNLTDDVEFSVNGIAYTYVPVPDANGFDSAVRYIRIRPRGTFARPSTATPTTFNVRIRVRVQ